MSCLFGDHVKTEEGFYILNHLKDANIWKILTSLLDPNTSFQQAYTYWDDLLKILGDQKHPLYDFLDTLNEVFLPVFQRVCQRNSIGGCNTKICRKYKTYSVRHESIGAGNRKPFGNPKKQALFRTDFNGYKIKYHGQGSSKACFRKKLSCAYQSIEIKDYRWMPIHKLRSYPLAKYTNI